MYCLSQTYVCVFQLDAECPVPRNQIFVGSLALFHYTACSSPECARSPWGHTPQNPKVPKWSYTSRRGFPCARSPWGHTPQNPKVPKWSCTSPRGFSLARASGKDGLRANDGFKPKFSGALSISRRNLAICAGDVRNAHGTAHRRHQNALKLPIQVGVVSRLPHAAARTRCARNEDFERSFARSELFSSRSRDPSRREVARRYFAKSRQI